VKPSSWKEIAEPIGIGAIVASLVFVGLQLRQAEVIARSEMNASILANKIETNALIVEYPVVWHKGNKGGELSEAEAEIFSRQVININNEAYYAVQQALLWGMPEVAELDIAVFAAYLYENPGAHRVWRAREDRLKFYRGLIVPDEQYTSDWIETIESKIALFGRAATEQLDNRRTQ